MEIAAHVEGMRRFQIHGQPWVTVWYSHDDARDTIRHLQLGEGDLPPRLHVGDAIWVTYLGSVAVSLRQRDE